MHWVETASGENGKFPSLNEILDGLFKQIYDELKFQGKQQIKKEKQRKNKLIKKNINIRNKKKLSK